MAVMIIRLVTIDDAAALRDFHLSNRAHLMPWEPLRPAEFHSLQAWSERLLARETEQEAGLAAYFIGLDPDDGQIIACCSLTNIIRGAFQACYMGYCVAAVKQGKGLMKSLCVHAIEYAFNQLDLNRVMANYMPSNVRSAVLLRQLGFIEEGRAAKYLNINGRFEDHILTALINPKNYVS
jgi:[ribosomal protein S5]-alanine N-acetyltransferase